MFSLSMMTVRMEIEDVFLFKRRLESPAFHYLEDFQLTIFCRGTSYHEKVGPDQHSGIQTFGSLPWNHLDVSKTRGGPPKSSHFNRVFHYKPSILGYPYFWKHPFVQWLFWVLRRPKLLGRRQSGRSEVKTSHILRRR